MHSRLNIETSNSDAEYASMLSSTIFDRIVDRRGHPKGTRGLQVGETGRWRDEITQLQADAAIKPNDVETVAHDLPTAAPRAFKAIGRYARKAKANLTPPCLHANILAIDEQLHVQPPAHVGEIAGAQERVRKTTEPLANPWPVID